MVYIYPSNYSNNTGVNGFGDWIIYISNLTNNWLPIGFLFLIWMTVFGIGMASGSRKALLSSSFVTFIFSIYLYRLGILTIVIPISLIILTIIGAIASKSEPSI